VRLGLSLGLGQPGAASAPPDDPAPERSTVLWLKADELSGSDGDRVTTIPDASGNGNDFDAQDVLRRGVLRVANKNGLNVLEFDGSGGNGTWYIGSDNMFAAVTEGATMYAVVRNDNENNSILHSFGGKDATYHFPFSDGNIYDGFGSSSRKSVGNPAPTMVEWRLYTWKSRDGEWKLFMDGAQIFTTATNTLDFDPLAKDLGQADNGWRGHFAELLVTDAYDDEAQQEEMQTYLADKWGLTI
jgi:hypothetical protein